MIYSAVGAIAVFGSFVVVMLWALLIGPADILIPVKIAIPIGYFGLLLHSLWGLKERDIAGLTFAAIEIIVILAAISGYPAIAGIYPRPSYLYLGENLSSGVRMAASLAFIIPLVFLVFAGLAIPLAIKYGGLRTGLSQRPEVGYMKIGPIPPLEETVARLKKLAEDGKRQSETKSGNGRNE